MFSLDIKTMVFVLLLGHLFTVILITAYRYKHPENKPIKMFAISKSMQLVGLVLIILRGIIPFALSVIIANIIILIGAAIGCSALLILIHVFNKRFKNIYLFLTIASIGVFLAILSLNNTENLRIAWISVSFAIFIIFPVLSFAKKSNSSILQKTIQILYFVVMLAFLLRAITALLIDTSMTMFSANAFQTISFMALYLELLISSVGVVLLAKEQIDMDLLRIAHVDDLTNIYNRRAFILKALQAMSSHTKKKSPISFVLFDIDYFKKINDTLGHDIGDQVLKQVVAIINTVLHDNHLFGRYGGDEFAILLQGTDEIQSNKIVENIRDKIEQLIFPYTNLPCTLSIGVISVVPDNNTDINMLYKLADNALYKSKQQGRNRINRAFL